MNCKNYALLLCAVVASACTDQQQSASTATEKKPTDTTAAQLLEPPSLEIKDVVEFTSLPTRITSPVSMQTIQAVRKRIKEAGDLTLNGALLKLPAPSATPSQFTLVAKNLNLKRGFINTSGHSLNIICESLDMDSKSIILSFMGYGLLAATPPPIGIHGANGVNGANGGNVNIYITKSLKSTLRVSLPGQIGGHGGDGINGQNGAIGRRGRNAEDGPLPFECKSGPGKGHPGGAGTPGGNAGNSGSGGNGGLLSLNFVNIPKPSSIPLKYTAEAGPTGEPGAVGRGGIGGQGGPGGHNSSNCLKENADRNRGANGPNGPDGNPGVTGREGAPGTYRVQKLVLP